MKPSQAKRPSLPAPAAPTRKYRNRPAEVDGEIFRSRLELRRWLHLKELERAGAIRCLRREVEYPLIPKQRRADGAAERSCKYVADFVYFDLAAGAEVVEDTKSKATRTPGYVIKRKLMLFVHGITVKEVTK